MPNHGTAPRLDQGRARFAGLAQLVRAKREVMIITEWNENSNFSSEQGPFNQWSDVQPPLR
jgi:hypothetical protein